MGTVAKYNLCKGISTLLTLGTPLITLMCCGDMFVHRSETALSAAGIFAILVTLLIFKDKIAEKWKTPSAFVISAIVFVLLLLVENIMVPMRYVCIMTMLATTIDEFTFKRLYKRFEVILPKEAELFKHVGFIFTTTKQLNELYPREAR